MSNGCPFFAHAIFPPLPRLRDEWLMIPNPDSNQCALITTAHSPCLMEREGPTWGACPRNPDLRENLR